MIDDARNQERSDCTQESELLWLA